jgi:sugar phosphate permease
MADQPVGKPQTEGGPTFPLAAGTRPTNVRTLILAQACGISCLLYLHRYTWGFIKKDLADDFGWDPVTFGWLDSCFLISYGFGQVPAGIACDWFGAHVLLGVMVLGWSLALAGMALAAGVASTAALSAKLLAAGFMLLRLVTGDVVAVACIFLVADCRPIHSSPSEKRA